MSKMKVVGKGFYSGEYHGTNYSKLQFIVETDIPKKFESFEGSFFESILCPFTLDNDLVQVGDFIRVYYNKYGKVDAVVVCNDKVL